MSKKGIKKNLQFKPEVTSIFDELDQFRDFCREFGHVFNEAHLGNNHSPYADFVRWQAGKHPRDNWAYVIKQVRRNA